MRVVGRRRHQRGAEARADMVQPRGNADRDVTGVRGLALPRVGGDRQELEPEAVEHPLRARRRATETRDVGARHVDTVDHHPRLEIDRTRHAPTRVPVGAERGIDTARERGDRRRFAIDGIDLFFGDDVDDGEPVPRVPHQLELFEVPEQRGRHRCAPHHHRALRAHREHEGRHHERVGAVDQRTAVPLIELEPELSDRTPEHADVGCRPDAPVAHLDGLHPHLELVAHKAPEVSVRVRVRSQPGRAS